MKMLLTAKQCHLMFLQKPNFVHLFSIFLLQRICCFSSSTTSVDGCETPGIPLNMCYYIAYNLLTPNVNYSGRTAPLTSKVAFYIFIQQIPLLNILNMVYTLRFFSLQYSACFIILTYLVPVLFTFYIQVC